MGELVEDFLKYAKVEAGVTSLAKSAVPIRDVARELERYAAQLLDGKDVRFSIESSEAPRDVVVDGVKLKTVLRNLVSNAIKFTQKGAVSLQIAQREGNVEFAVTDSGPGIRREDLEVIFQPFRQLDGSDTRQYGGIGLGLALSHRLARLMGGTIEVSSELGVGSTFILKVPVAVAATSPQRPAQTSEGEQAAFAVAAP